MVSNTAIYLERDGHLSVRQMDETYNPTESQSLIQVKYSAINPADVKHFFMGLSDYVAGYEWIGTVLEVGPTSPFSPGQQVFGASLPGNHRPVSVGAHQDYLLAEAEWTDEVPQSMDPLVAVTLPVAVKTSIDALFNCLGFAFPPTGITGEDPTGQPILIWGGASALGQAAIQLARLAGFAPIITTASTRNHSLLQTLGATHCFDYRSHSVVEDIQEAVRATGKKLNTVYDTVATGTGFGEDISQEDKAKIGEEFDKSSPAMAKRCCNDEMDLKLCATLPVEKDPAWIFTLPYQLPYEGWKPAPGTANGVEGLLAMSTPERGERLRQVWHWVLQNHAEHWTPMKIRRVQGVETGIAAIKEVFEGKAGGEKVVIDRPL